MGGNISKGITAVFDRKTLTLKWGAAADLSKCRALKTITHDLFGKPFGPARRPGPFRDRLTAATAVRLYGR